MDTQVVEGSSEAGPAGSDVEGAARRFAAALAETPTFRAFEEASVRFRDDERAQEAYSAYQAQQRTLQPFMMLGAASDEQRAELERLYEAFVAEPSAAALLEAQTSLTALCRAIDGLLSERIGLGFAATCSPGCCG
ncbi:MAG: YlbF family regulator [Actinomycetota bacterium]